MKRRDHLVRLVVLLVVVLSISVGCSSKSNTGSPKAPEGSTAPTLTDHQRELSQGETVALTAELVPVPGYEYTDVSSAERTAALASQPSTITASAFHGVTDTNTGKEIAFLALSVPTPNDAMHSPNYAERFGQWALSTSAVTPKEFSGQQVWFAEDPSRPNSRYQYAWLRHGTIGWLDGPDQTAVEQFLAAYFAVPFHGAEDPVLAARMVDLPGYVFTNAVDRTKQETVAEELFPGATASMHYVFDQTHVFGGLVLVGPVTDVSDDQLVKSVGTWSAKTTGQLTAPGLQAQGDFTAGGVTIHHLIDPATDLNYYIWRWPDTGVVGWFATSRPDIAEGFLKSFVVAQPVPR